MKKYVSVAIVLILAIIAFVAVQMLGSNEYKGEETELSSHFLSDGYAINISRFYENEEDSTKGKIKMSFQIVTKYTSTYDYRINADYNIKKVAVSNVRILSKPKKGKLTNLSILKRYSNSLDESVTVTSARTKYEYELASPSVLGIENSIWIDLEDIATHDKTDANILNPTMEELYDYYDVTTENIGFKVGFRVELETVGGKILYKEYEVEVPPTDIEIDNAEYSYEFYETENSVKDKFLERK